MIPTTWTTWAPLSPWLAGQEAARDTIWVAVAPSGIANVGEWGLLALLVLILVGMAVLLAFVIRLDGHARRLVGVARQMEDRSRPMLDRAAAVADSLDSIIRPLRDEARHFTGSVRALSDRLRQASAHMETRIDEFNALLEVVQTEAEETFLKVASAVRGVRAGARVIESGRDAASGPAGTDSRGGWLDGEAGATLGASRPNPGREPPARAVEGDDGPDPGGIHREAG